MAEYRPNSHKSKEAAEERVPQRKIEPVVSGARVRKRSGIGKLEDLFMPGDADSVKSYILMDVLVPSIKRMISDIVCNGINMLLGESRKGSSDLPVGRVSYRSYYQDRDDRTNRPRSVSELHQGYDDILFPTRGDAELVLDQMFEVLDHFDVVTIADLKEMCDLKSEFTENKYGWTDLRGACVVRVRDGYMLDLPRATNI